MDQVPRAQGSVWGRSAEAALQFLNRKLLLTLITLISQAGALAVKEVLISERALLMWLLILRSKLWLNVGLLPTEGLSPLLMKVTALCLCAVHRPFPRAWRGRKLFWVGENPSCIQSFLPKRRTSYCCAKQKLVICSSAGKNFFNGDTFLQINYPVTMGSKVPEVVSCMNFASKSLRTAINAKMSKIIFEAFQALKAGLFHEHRVLADLFIFVLLQWWLGCL